MTGPKSQIPNIFTCLNLLCGCAAISQILQSNLSGGSYLLIFCLVLDFLDGFSARKLDSYTEIGKQLDSLADMVSFGVAPSMILHQLMLMSFPLSDLVGTMSFFMISYLPFLFAVFAALRLARFNTDESQSNDFVGMPTPAAAIFIISLPLILNNSAYIPGAWIMNTYVIAIITIVLSILMVSGIRFLSLKFRTVKLSENKPQYILIIGSLILILAAGVSSVPIIILLYLILSLVARGNLTGDQ